MSKHQPLISIIIPAYNQAQYLQPSIESALNQSYEHNEIIVVDDGSTDETANIAKSYGDQIQYIFQKNHGLAGARNTGIRAARGEYVGLLDADDIWLPNFLETLSSLIKKYPSAAVFYCAANCIDEEGKAIPQRVGFPNDSIKTPCMLYTTLLKSNFLIPSTIVLHRQTVIDEGLFDESFSSIGVEDWDLWLRLLPKHAFIGKNDPLVKYRVHQKSLSANPDKMHNSMKEVVVKHFGIDDGNYGKWDSKKKIAYGGFYRYQLVTSIQRNKDWSKSTEYLTLALKSDPDLSEDINLFYDLALGNQPFGHRGTDYQLDLRANAHQIDQLIFNVFESTKNDKALECLKNKTYGTAYFALGLAAYNTSHLSLSRYFSSKALRYQPILLRNRQIIGIILKSFLGPKMLQWLRQENYSG